MSMNYFWVYQMLMYLAKKLTQHNNKILYRCRQHICRGLFEKTYSEDGVVQVMSLNIQNQKIQKKFP